MRVHKNIIKKKKGGHTLIIDHFYNSLNSPTWLAPAEDDIDNDFLVESEAMTLDDTTVQTQQKEEKEKNKKKTTTLQSILLEQNYSASRLER